MKKTILYSLALLASFGFASCNGDYDDWADPQSYAQESDAAAHGISFVAGPEANVVLPDSDGAVRLVEVQSTDSDVAGVTLKNLTVNGQKMNGTVNGKYITVPANDLAKLAYAETKSRAAKATPLAVETEVSINLKSGDAVTFATKGETTGSVTPEATPAVDPAGYFLLGNFEGSGWDPSLPIWMTANGDGTYSATVKTVNFNAVNYFKFYGGSGWSDAATWDDINPGQLGAAVNGDVASEGMIVWDGDPVYTSGPQSAGIFSTGSWVVTLDPVNMTYNVKRAPSKYYVINYANRYVKGSKVLTGKRLMLYSLGDNIYSLTTNWRGNNDVKFWGIDDFGSSANLFGATDDNTGAEEGSVTQSQSGFIASPAKGYYRLTVNMNDATYKWEAVAAPSKTFSSVTVAGKKMKTLRTASHNWYLENVDIASTTQVKFTANDGTVWGAASAATVSATNYGFHGGQAAITVPAGKYSFYLNDIDGTINIVAE